MLQERLGLFDTPPSRREVWLSLSTIGALVVAGVVAFPFLDVHVGQSAPFIPTLHAISFACDLMIASILYAQAAVVRTRSLTVLASGFVFMGLLVIPYVLSFPGAFAPNGLFGDPGNTPGWLMLVRRFTFPLLVVGYVLFDRLDRAPQHLDVQRKPLNFPAWISGATLLAAAVTALTIFRSDWLPTVFSSREEAIPSTVLAINIANVVVVVSAIGTLLRKRLSLLDMWLLAALATWLVLSVFHLAVHTRFTVGFYALHFVIMASHLLVLLALITEANRLYARLALSMAAREREHDAHLMSVGTMAATFAHEIGQPLTAITTNAAAGLSWLSRPEPNVERAVSTLREVIDGANRIIEVTKSLRAMIAEEPGTLSEFSVNDLARQAASLLERELAAAGVALKLDLAAADPKVLADRVQLEQVLLNLMVNAIDAMRVTPSGKRRITLRSMQLDGGGALLELSDTGSGISALDIEHIFEPFYTTKQSGTGLGLAISRTLVEEYGGRLWASNNEGRGATFHLQLPSRKAEVPVAAE